MSRRHRDCCGVITRDLYQRIDPGNTGETKYLVKFRGGVKIDGKRLMPNETAYVGESPIKEILSDSPDMLYFIHSSEKSEFLEKYPEFKDHRI